MSARIELHFEGDIAEDHKISLRTLGKTLNHLQSAIDRAPLDEKHGQVWKHARLKAEDYALTEFILNQPREGGYILDMFSASGDAIGTKIRKTLENALEDGMGQGAEEAARLRQQAKDKYNYAVHNTQDLRTFQTFRENANDEMDRRYGERSIAKEFDQIFSIIRHEDSGDSKISITLEIQNELKTFQIDRETAHAFHKAVSRRDLADPVIYKGVLRSLDKGNKYSGSKGKFKNSDTGREVTIHIASSKSFDELHPFLAGEQEITLVAAPVVEYGSFDPIGGDIYFIGILEAIENETL